MAIAPERHDRVPQWRNATFLKWFAQIVTLAAVVALIGILGSQAFANFADSGVSFGWDWLTDPTGIDLREGIDTSPDSGVRALAVGAVNTLRVAITGILAATVLGILIGIGRLSSIWIVNKISNVYIETIRNIPLLVQLFFWAAIAIALPILTPDDVGTYWFKASNKGFAFAWASWNGGFWPWLVFVITGIVAGRYVARWRHRVQEETGKTSYAGTFWLLTVVLFAAVGWIFWPVLAFMSPVFHWLAGLVADLPPMLIPTVTAIASAFAAGWWIKSFLESRRTPAGLGKLTDDDWFRMIFAGVVGVLGAALVFFLSGLTFTTVAGELVSLPELALIGLSNVLDWLGNGFANQGGQPLVFSKASVVQKGMFVQYGDTGAVMTVAFYTLWVGLTLYAAAFIGEIVRGGILAVSRGQTEASEALGLRRSQYMRLVILPQAFRIILPPMGNQFLNLFKNTSLGIAVGYAGIVAIGTMIYNLNGQSLPIVLVWMAFFTTGSLVISAIVNYFNRKMTIVER